MATHFFWDPVEDNIVQERDDTGEITAEYATEPYLYGNLISQNRGGVESQYHFDPQGSTLALSDDSQQVTDTYSYAAFGEVTEHTGRTVNPFQYVGQRGCYRDMDEETYSVRRRSISIRYARWLSTGPLAVYRQSNPFVYVLNSPISFTAPAGFLTLGIFAPENESDKPADKYKHVEVDPSMRCLSEAQWKDWLEKCENKGKNLPGRSPKEFPPDYPGFPEVFNKVLPVYWGIEIARGRDLRGKMPGPEQIDDDKDECLCLEPYANTSRMRPKGNDGKYPVPGQAQVPCTVGEQVILRYPGICIGKDDKGCVGPWNAECTKKSCAVFILYECKMEGGMTYWRDPNIRGVPSTVFVKCK